MKWGSPFFCLFAAVSIIHSLYAATVDFSPDNPPAATTQNLRKPLKTVRRVFDLRQWEIESTPEIQALVRGLHADPVKLYEYVRNNIDYHPTFGLAKSPTMTLLDREGNDIEQSALLIALLAEAGFESAYVNGYIQLNGAQVMNWLGVPDDPELVEKVFGDGGKSFAMVYATGGSIDSVVLEHIWVKVTIGGVNYVFDPSFKEYQYTEGIDLDAATGFDESAVMAGASSGMVAGDNYLQYLNRQNVRTSILQYSGNLVNTLVNDHPDSSIEQIIGGRDIIPVTGQPLLTVLPHFYGDNEEWPAESPAYVTYVRIMYDTNQCPGIGDFELDLNAVDVYGKELLLYMIPGEEETVLHLRLDGEEIATSTYYDTSTFGIEIHHPSLLNEGTYLDQYFDPKTIDNGGVFAFVFGFGFTDRPLIEKHRRHLEQLLFEGTEEDSIDVTGRSLLITGLNYLAETGYAVRLNDRICDTITLRHQDYGYIAQTGSMFMSQWSARSRIRLDGITSTPPPAFHIEAGLGSALEWAVIDQMQPMSAVSTVKLVDLAVIQNLKIYDTDQTTWETVRPLLTGYSEEQLLWLDTYIYFYGFRLVLPENGALSEGIYEGPGLFAFGDSTFLALIMGGLDGGFGVEQSDLQPYSCLTSQEEMYNPSNNPTSDEPIDLVTGAYTDAAIDMSVGNGGLPFGLGFERRYNSRSRLKDTGIGLGWSHNFEISAVTGNDGFRALGGGSPVDAASIIMAIHACNRILESSQTPDRILVFNTILRWATENLIDNVVNIRSFGTNLQFLKLADGSYHPEAGRFASLEMTPQNCYRMISRNGVGLLFGDSGLIQSWMDSNGNTLSFGYNGSLLSDVSNGMGRSISIAYNDQNRIETVTDQSGRSSDYSYDTNGNLLNVSDPMDYVTSYEYDLPGRMIRRFTAIDPAIPFMTNTYDGFDRVIAQQDFYGNPYTYYYAYGASAEEIQPEGHSRFWTFDPQGRTLSMIDPSGNTTRFAYDGPGRIQCITLPEGNGRRCEYDSHHNLTKLTMFPKSGSVETDMITEYLWDPMFGNLLQKTDPLGRTTDYTYDAAGNPIQIMLPEVNGSRPTYSYSVNSRGQIETITGPESWTRTFTYDPVTADRIGEMTDPSGLGITIGVTFDSVGNSIRKTDAMGNQWAFEYDANRRLRRVTSPLPFLCETLLEYNAGGRLTAVHRQTGDPDDPWQTMETAYNVGGAETAIRTAAQDETVLLYNSHQSLWKRIHSNGSTDEFLYDSLNRPWRRIDPLGQIAEERIYSANGRLIALTDANGNTIIYEYDGHDRLIREVFPDTSFTAYQYDNAGNLLQQTNRNGDVISYGYDELNRTISRTLPGPIVTYTEFDSLGRIMTVTGPDGVTEFDYDNAGRVIAVTDPALRVVQYEYDDNHNVRKIIYPDGYFAEYRYDEMNRLASLLENGTVLLADYHYDALSRRIMMHCGNGVSTTYAHSIDNNLLSIDASFADGPVALDWTHDSMGRVTRFEAMPPEFVYNPQMTGSHDFLANTLNQYSYFDGVPLTYDAAGNLAGLNGYAFTFSPDNQLIEAVSAEHSIFYEYNGLGQRCSHTVDGSKTHLLTGGLRLLAEYDDSGTLLRRYIHGPGMDEPVLMLAGTERYFLHQDNLNSVVAISDGSGQRIESFAYSPFGHPSNISTTGCPFGFTGREYDSLTQLSYFRTRYFSPILGRFLSPDRLGILGGDLNLYKYVRNNPLNLVDPLGMSPVKKPSFNWDTFANGSWSVFKGSLAVGITVVIEVGSSGTLTPAAYVTGSYAAFELGSGIGNVYNAFIYPDLEMTPTSPFEMIGYATGNDNLQYAGQVTDDVVQLVYSPADTDPTTITGYYLKSTESVIEPITKVEDYNDYYCYAKDAYAILGTSVNPPPAHIPQNQYDDYVHVESGFGESVAVPPLGIYENY